LTVGSSPFELEALPVVFFRERVPLSDLNLGLRFEARFRRFSDEVLLARGLLAIEP